MTTGEMVATDTGFIARHGLWSAEQTEAAAAALEAVERHGLKRVRIGWGDQHGIMRGKTLSVGEFRRCLSDGKDFQLVTTMFDTTNHPVVPPFAAGNFEGVPELNGLPDGVLVPDPLTFRVLPWVSDTGWVLADAYFNNGRPVPFSTRQVYREQLERLAALGYGFTAGLEMEFYVLRLEDPMLATEDCGWPPTPPKVSGLSHGYQYLTESRGDEIHELLVALEDHLTALGLPPATIEDEWGPGQIEFTFDPRSGLRAADDALLFRTAVKQICRRLGYHATFMARPVFPEYFSSGWHVHQSLSPLGEDTNAFADPSGAARLSGLGTQWLAGLLEHAVAGSVFTAPTITGYKRFRPDSFAPDRVAWAVENRGALLRVVGEPGSTAARIENRIGDPAANPYLLLASQVAAGIDGIERGLQPPAAAEEPYQAQGCAPLPASLIEAVDALDADAFFREAFGAPFVDYLVKIKRHEIGRFLSHVTDWEHTEYFEMY